MAEHAVVSRGEAATSRRLTRRPAVAMLILIAGVGGALLVLRHRDGATQRAAPAMVRVARGDLAVTVGGVGRIVDARAVDAPAVAATSSSVTPGSPASPTPAPPGSVFPRASGSIARLLVSPGEKIHAGQVVAFLDDRGVTAASVRQSKTEVASARAELLQKQTSDPTRGLPPTTAELVASRAAVASAHARLARLLGPARPADLDAARADLARVLADAETLRGGSRASRRRAISLARRNVELTSRRLEQLLAPPSPVEVSAAEAEVRKAEADLAALQTPPPGPSPEALAAARQAIAAAQAKLAAAVAAGVAADVAAAQLELAKANADLAALTQPPPAPAQAALASAQQTLEAARQKLAKALAPATPADLAAARLERERAQNDLRALLAGPSAAALAAADEAVRSARAKLALVSGPPLAADVEAARADARRAEADLAVLRGRGGPASPRDIQLARLKLRAALDRLAAAHVARGLLTVRSSTSGTVTSVLAARGAPVDVATPVAAVADLTKLAVSVDLNEFDVARVTRGLRAIVRVDALGGKAFAGRVVYASATGSNTGGVVTFPVSVELARVRGLRAGMNVSVRIVVRQRRGVVSIPLAAVARDANGHDLVTIVDAKGGTSTRRVTLGLATKDRVEVVKGLAVDERIASGEPAGGGGQGG